jgi:hypothetical protein
MTDDLDRGDFDREEFDVILKQMAQEHRPELPSPGLIWFRAQVARKLRQKEKIERPVVIMCGLVGLACAMFLINFVAGNWGSIQDVLNQEGWFLLPVVLATITALAASWALVRKSHARR